MRKLNSNEKKVAQALLRDMVERSNYGMLARSGLDVSMRDHMAFSESGWSIDRYKNIITFCDIPAYKIIRKYAARKQNGVHKELQPRLEYLGGPFKKDQFLRDVLGLSASDFLSISGYRERYAIDHVLSYLKKNDEYKTTEIFFTQEDGSVGSVTYSGKNRAFCG